MGRDFDVIILSFTSIQFDWLLNASSNFAFSHTAYLGQISHHLPAHPLLQFLNLQAIIFPSVYSVMPLENAVTVFLMVPQVERQLFFP